MIQRGQAFLLVVNGHVHKCAETFMRGLSACNFDIHQPDVVVLKAHLTREGRSDADIEALPSNQFRDRYLAYKNSAGVSCSVPRACCTYSSVMFCS